jgi:hypothetical protein
MKTEPKNIDVDATWDGKGSLDDHRQKAFKTIKEVGFGQQPEPAKPKADDALTEEPISGK